MHIVPLRAVKSVFCTAIILITATLGITLGTTLGITLAATPSIAAGDLTITVIDVGQGDATLIQSPSGKTLLFDGGKSGRGTSIILPFLASVNVDTLDYVVASHYHSDHIGGLDEVIAAIPIREAVLDRGWSYTTLTYNAYVNAAGSQRQTLTQNQVIDLGEGVTVTCIALNSNDQLSGPYNNGSHENEYDVCLLVQYGGFDYFQAGDLTGDNGSGSEDIESSVAPLAGDIDVYHVNHHGSYTSSNPNFLQGVQAEVSIISVGNNGYGHPHQAVLDRLVQYGSFVYQTEPGDGGTLSSQDLRVINGHVSIVTDGLATYSVSGDLWDIDEDNISDVESSPSLAFQMHGNHPNPFNPATEISFTNSLAGEALLAIYDVKGRLVHSSTFAAIEGLNTVQWRGHTTSGAMAPGGVYLYRVQAPGGSGTGRMSMLK